MSDRSESTLSLLIDAGNSRIKVSQSDEPETLIFVDKEVNVLCDWLAQQSFTSLYCASVRDEQALMPLTQLCQERAIAFNLVTTGKSFHGLHNSYEDVSNMGVDRWLSMIACMEFKQPVFAVLSFGTAITCDIVAHGKHQGGWIIPGRQLMQNALTDNTARVFAEDSQAKTLSLGNSTPECVDTGCFAAATGAVMAAEHYLRTHFEQYCIFLTGGDDNVLTSQNGDAIFRVENLVLQGLSRYANFR